MSTLESKVEFPKSLWIQGAEINEFNLSVTFVPQGHILAFEGNFEEYEEDKRRHVGTEADQPHRVKYKPLAW